MPTLFDPLHLGIEGQPGVVPSGGEDPLHHDPLSVELDLVQVGEEEAHLHGSGTAARYTSPARSTPRLSPVCDETSTSSRSSDSIAPRAVARYASARS